MTIFTIGHSTRPIDEFLRLLISRGVEELVDVRTIPRSRYNPQFNSAELSGSLRAESIDYMHLPGLGGLRKPRPDSVNTGWRNASFRGYADYMQSPEFRKSLGDCLALAERQCVALMCAEAVPWRCHRSLIADALLARAIEVIEIIGPGSMRPHRLTPWARVDGTGVTYPASAASNDGRAQGDLDWHQAGDDGSKS